MRERTRFLHKRRTLAGDGFRGRVEPLAPRGARAARHALAHGGDDFRQRALGIAEDCDGGRVILAELPGINVEMDELDRGRHRIDVGRQRQREQVGADREQHVILLEHFAHVWREPDHGPAKKRMRGGKRGRVGHEFGIDGRAQKLRELHQLGMRAALRDRIAGHDHGALGLGKQIGRGFDCGAVAAQPRRNAGGRGEIDVGVGAQDVAGQRQEYRPRRRRQCGLGGAVHEPRKIGQAVHLRGPFDQRARDGRQIRPQNGFGGGKALLVLAGGDENGRARLLRVVEHAHGIAQPGRDVKIDDRELARGLRIAVRHPHDRRFLEPEQVTQLILRCERVHQRQLGCAGIAEHDLDAFLLEQSEEGMLSGHQRQDGLPAAGQ